MALIQEIVEEPIDTHSIQLNETEATLRRLFLDVAKHIEATSPTQEPIVLRFTGGWVRDKLLGVLSHDIDVAINTLTGLQFGHKLLEYLQTPGNPEKYGLEGVASTEKQEQSAAKADKSKMVRGLHTIAANPEKSKHLETVATKVLGIDIDLVNLRKEVYDEESRNPQMEFGTAEEDALRRDATVNAMFYNLNTQQLEDFTGRGRADMRDKILRTPLDPYQTFIDDPLRVLRLIRFASRLGWSIESSATVAMQQSEIKSMLQKKISRERVGIELEKALRGPDPHEALRLILKLDLYTTVFCDPAVDTEAEFAPQLENAEHTIDILEAIFDEDTPLHTLTVRDAEERFLAWQLAALVPYRDAPLLEPSQPGRKAPPPIAAQIAREGIKATSKTCDLVTTALRNLDDIRSAVALFNEQSRTIAVHKNAHQATTRDHLGMEIRRWGASWRSQLLFALLADISDNPEQTDVFKHRYSNFLEHLRDLDILNAYQLRPLLDGKQLAKALNTPPGPWMKDALDVVMAWQLRNPGVANTKEAVEEVKKQGELAHSLAMHFLKLTVRPLFLKTKPDNVTEQGRFRTNGFNPQLPASIIDDETARPWKNAQNVHVLNLLSWTTESLTKDTVQQLWPLLVPPTLTLLDDRETKYRKLGADLLRNILLTTPSDLLKRTGLGPVFEAALLPCLTYLPPLTDEQESLQLLPAIYQALYALIDVRFPTTTTATDVRSPTTTPTTSTNGAMPAERVMCLDTVVRRGVIYGFTHTDQHPAIITMLFHNLIILINKLGINFVKHLKFVLPMLNEALSNRLATERLGLLRQAVAAVTTVVQTCWPRMVIYRGEVLRGLTLCWLNIHALNSVESQELRRDLQHCVDVLREAVSGQVNFDAELGLLIDADPRLKSLGAMP